MAVVHHKSDQKFSLPAVSKRYIHLQLAPVVLLRWMWILRFSIAHQLACAIVGGGGQKMLVDAIQDKTLFASRCDMSNHDRCCVMVMPSLSAIRQPTKRWHHKQVPTWLKATIPSSPLSGCGLDDWRVVWRRSYWWRRDLKCLLGASG